MESVENKELKITEIFSEPIELIWEAWSSPTHLIHWWGPNGFTCTIQKMDFKVEGEWRLTLHGPDGTNYPNRSIFKEIILYKKISFEHFNPHFITTISFETVDNKNCIDWVMLFDTAEMRDIVVKAHKADEGLKQNIERLHQYLAEINKMN